MPRACREESWAAKAWRCCIKSALKMLGLNDDVGGFETRVARDAKPPRSSPSAAGLRVPLIPTGFDGLCWAIIGQQINVKFAARLRREILHLAGEQVGDMRTHPAPERVANIAMQGTDQPPLFALQSGLSDRRGEGSGRRQARYRKSCRRVRRVAAEKKLTAVRGIGTWTARYAMLRGGFADAAPVGDSALATALQRLHGREERPDHEEVHEMMKAFAPHRSLATCISGPA